MSVATRKAPVVPPPRQERHSVPLDVQQVTHRFTTGTGEVWALDDVSLRIEPGEFCAIIGPSGCGKTTLLNLLAGLDRPTSGTVAVGGTPPTAGDPRLSYVFSRDALLPWRTAEENAALGLELRGVPKAARLAKARQTLQTVGLHGFESAYRAELSQGMRQRVALARSFAMEPAVMLMDEPFSALDAQTRILVQDTFIAMWERLQTTVVLITHDLAEAIALADRVVLLTRGPGRIKSDVRIDLPRPRSMSALQGDSRFHEIYQAIWSDLEDEFRVAADH